MSAADRGFPWGSNQPTRRQRLLVALALTGLAVAVVLGDFHRSPGHRPDFTQAWFGAQTLLDGRNPYDLIGPGLEFEWEYPLLYPATSLVASIPFTILSLKAATILFIAVSTFLLAYGITVDSWHRLPLFPSAAFVDSLHTAQWTIVLTAAVFLPWLCSLAAAKPQNGLAILASATSRVAIIAGALGAVVMLGLSLVLLPGWVSDWLPLVRSADHMMPAIAGPIGFIIPVVMLRWRRPEAWLVMLTACLPQTFSWYSALILLSTAATYREACVLSLISTLGFVLTVIAIDANPAGLPRVMWAIFLCTTYLPVIVAILRRPNEGKSPFWLQRLGAR